tara:strand:+ start:56 stop:307 length:252 start_codon:yes stop_codon:yes gene_type:complete
MKNKITIEMIKQASKGWTDHQCVDILIEASRMRTRLGSLSNMTTNLVPHVIDRKELYHAMNLADARIKYAKYRLYSLMVGEQE